MSDIHRRFFRLYLMQLDGRPLSSAQRDELQSHRSTCPSCRADLQLYQGLRAAADQRWPATTAPIALEKVLRGAQSRARLRWVTVPLRAVIWVGFALLALLLVQWVFTYLRPAPAVVPAGSPTPDEPTPAPTGTPAVFVDEVGKIPVEPLLSGEAPGQGSWSPQGDYFFIPLVETPIPGSDRRSTSLHFISASTGEECRASETFLGTQVSQNYAWLDNERVLFIDRSGRALVFTRCQEGMQDLSDRFAEPLVRVAQPLASPEQNPYGPLLLEAASAYWLLDPVTLEARPLVDPVPSPELGDSFAQPLSGNQISVLQPVAGKPERSWLVLLDLDSGQVLRSLEIETGWEEGRAPIVEWMGPEQLFVWGFGTTGPLLVDLSVDPPRQVRVLPELLGRDLIYPDQINSMGAFYAPAGDSFHIVAHLNLPEDQSILLYHNETGQVEVLPGDRQVLMIFPGDQRMPLVPWQDPPSYADEYDVLWVDAPGGSQVNLQVSGHTPRNYPNLQTRLLPGGERMLFSSTQGISLVDLTSGETQAFWRLSGAENATLPSLSLAPNGRVLIVTADTNSAEDGQSQGNLLYWLPLEE